MISGKVTCLGNSQIGDGVCVETINPHNGKPSGKLYRTIRAAFDPTKTSRYVETPDGKVQYLGQRVMVRIASEDEFLEMGCLESFPA